jgi:hypothetical protein
MTLSFTEQIGLVNESCIGMFGLFGTWGSALERVLYEILPSEFENPITNLYINAFDLKTMSNVVFSNFQTKGELMDAIFKSCHLPFVLDYKMTRNGYIDGFVYNCLMGINWDHESLKNIENTNNISNRLVEFQIGLWDCLTKSLFPKTLYECQKLHKRGRNVVMQSKYKDLLCHKSK